MAEEEPHHDGLKATATGLGPIDVVVGVATWNNATTVADILRTARLGAKGLDQAVVVYADGGSLDGTPVRAQEVIGNDASGGATVVDLATRTQRRPRRGEGRAGAIQAIMSFADEVEARACVILDADLQGVSEEWVRRLADPVLDDVVDFVAPYYTRPRFDGALTTGIVYPAVRALFGKRVRFPIASDFACSAKLLDRCLAHGVASDLDLSRYGPELWLSVQALTGVSRLRQVVLGPKLAAPGAISDDLSKTIARVIGGLFAEMERHLAVWQKVRGSEPVELDGQSPRAELEPGAVESGRALEAFRVGHRNLAEVWALALPPLTMVELKKLAHRPDPDLRFPDQLWARIIYDFALAFRLRKLSRDHLLAAFTPLYLGWFGSFVAEMSDATQSGFDARVERLCLQYEAEKPYLISRWRWPDTFNP
jgi:hypothetical protein